jgi:predicted HicB family RNase H-like nuclease
MGYPAGMATTMVIDGVETQIEYDPDEDRFYGLAAVGKGGVSFHGRDPDELRAAFREVRVVQEEESRLLGWQG